MKRTWIPIVIVVSLLIVIIGGAVGYRVLEQYIPTREKADLAEELGVSGETTAIYYNNDLTESKAVAREGQVYLPITWVNENLNEKFYWDNVEKLLVYTLPDTIVYADKRTKGGGGAPLLLAENDEVYLSAGLVANYTDVRLEMFSDEGVNRIFVDDIWGDRTIGTAGKKTAVRVLGGIKSPVLTTVEKGSRFQILETMDDWAKVRTQDGYIGYLQNTCISGEDSETVVSTFSEPEYTSISMEGKVCMVWHQIFEEGDNQKLEELIARTKGVNVVAPTWLMLTDNNGNYESYASREYVDKAHSLGLQVWAVLDNFNKGENVNSGILFSQASVRKDLIARLMADVETYDLDGINLDIESIAQEARPHYVQFIRELSVDCRKKGIILSVDNYVPSAYTSNYNRAEQGRVADYVIIMGYDEHYAGGEAGSVASLPYVEGGIQRTLAEVPAEKVINAIPFYTRVWTEKNGKTTSSALGIEAAAAWVADNQVELYWQEELGQYYGELQDENSISQIWLEDERSIELKMQLIDQYDLAGVGCWKLGLEPESIWDIVKAND